MSRLVIGSKIIDIIPCLKFDITGFSVEPWPFGAIIASSPSTGREVICVELINPMTYAPDNVKNVCVQNTRIYLKWAATIPPQIPLPQTPEIFLKWPRQRLECLLS